MDTAIPLKDIFQWEVRSWSSALPLWRKHLPEQRPSKCLAIGERGGGLSLWLAGEGLDVTCTDLRALPAETRMLHDRYGVADRIRYQQADATALPFAEASYDVVIFKSVIGALGAKDLQRQAIREMHRVLKPGGVLLFAENLHGSPLHGLLRRRFVSWSSYWRYLDPVNDRDLFAPFIRLEEGTRGFIANLGRTEGQRDVLARFDAMVRPLIPRRQRTIWYGAAIKG
ncbi:MAG TPA: class I SAM-dependent methyltransferase [Flavobacteriales bacterium]|nr:class I SAM-dependent methyltransferase [Flavobacteriales bacterium]